MGPYCNFCGRRCFTYFPQETPQHILSAYGTSTIIATCVGGQRFEKERVGYCYDDIKAIISGPTPVGVDADNHGDAEQLELPAAPLDSGR